MDINLMSDNTGDIYFFNKISYKVDLVFVNVWINVKHSLSNKKKINSFNCYSKYPIIYLHIIYSYNIKD